MRATETTHRLIKVTSASTGAAVTGLALGDFTVTAKALAYGAATWSDYTSSAAITEIASGLYDFAFVAPPSPGWWRVLLEHASHNVWNGSWEGECEVQDLDSLYGAVARPVAVLSANVEMGAQATLELVAYRYRSFTVSIVDQNGDAIDISGYTGLALSIRSQDQTTTKWDATHGNPAGVVLTAAGSTLSVVIPEDATFFAALPAATDSVTLYWEVTGNVGGDAAKTTPIIRSSPCIVYRREVGT
jgi:hypothetical protein